MNDTLRTEFQLEDVDRYAFVDDFVILFMKDDMVCVAHIAGDDDVHVVGYFDPHKQDDEKFVEWLSGVYYFLSEPIARLYSPDYPEFCVVFTSGETPVRIILT